MAVVVKECAYALVHVPNFVRYGSKPIRDIALDGRPGSGLEQKIYSHIRTFEDAVAYPPNQVFIGNMHPDQLHDVAQPWYEHQMEDAHKEGPFGEIMAEDQFYGWLKASDDFNLVWLTADFLDRIRERTALHPLTMDHDLKKLATQGVDPAKIAAAVDKEGALPLYHEGLVVGCVRRDHDADDTLKAHVLMENLMTKASGALVVRHLLKRADLRPEEIDFLVSCSEDAVGDRYNRGGGSLSKAIGEMCRCVNGSGHDVKAFCAAPIHAIVSAASYVEAGVYERVVVVGGGCLAKIGMKYAGHLKNNMPILEDVLGAIAFLITKDDGVSPVIRLDCVGKHNIGASSNQQDIMTSLIVKPLDKLGMRMLDVDRYATEMHNPEVTLPAGSGNTPLQNYKIMGALAAIRKELPAPRLTPSCESAVCPAFLPPRVTCLLRCPFWAMPSVT